MPRGDDAVEEEEKDKTEQKNDGSEGTGHGTRNTTGLEGIPN